MTILLNILIITAWIIGILLFLALIISFLRIRINIGYLEKKRYLAVYFYRLKIFASHKAVVGARLGEPDKKLEADQIINQFKFWTKWFKENKSKLAELFKFAQKKVRIQTYSIILDIGVGNAATTGIVCGAASTFISLITAFIGNFFEIEEHTSTIVNPKSDKMFDLNGNIIINFKIVGLLSLWKKAKKMEIFKELEVRN
ncbi:MAG: DUF2953 domain-containing protein [Oscillospiraceae bacterium]|nr:DUF2953 domain-containing protein [Oscillospiraceae bacterium]